MKFSVAGLLLLTAIPAFASPVDFTRTVQERSNNHVLVARAPKATKCGTHEYTAAQINIAFNNGQAQSVAGTKIKALNKRKYPTKFNNGEGISLPDCVGIPPPFIEFPILRDNTAFSAGKEQLTDRVIYKEISTGVFQFCGVDTHEGVIGNGVKACDPVGAASSSSSVSSVASSLSVSSASVSSASISSASSASVSSASASSASSAAPASSKSASAASASSAAPSKSGIASKAPSAAPSAAPSKASLAAPSSAPGAAAPSKTPVIAEPSKVPVAAPAPSKAPIVALPSKAPVAAPVPPKAPGAAPAPALPKLPKLPSFKPGRKGGIL